MSLAALVFLVATGTSCVVYLLKWLSWIKVSLGHLLEQFPEQLDPHILSVSKRGTAGRDILDCDFISEAEPDIAGPGV